MKVQNINGTSGNICKCGSWLDHWKNISGLTVPSCCSEKTCTQKPEVGAHVQKDSSTDSNWCIIPHCKTHNSKNGVSIEVVDSTKLISANASETCGRR